VFAKESAIQRAYTTVGDHCDRDRTPGAGRRNRGKPVRQAWSTDAGWQDHGDRQAGRCGLTRCCL
jgi:hypothetical protein